jgi:hypothetical protein
MSGGIKTLIKILKHKNREDLARLLKGASGEINESTNYGHYWNSMLSTFVITAPLELYYKLKGIGKNDYKLLLDSLIEIYPPTDGEPEITSIDFRIETAESVDDDNPMGAEIYLGDTIRIFLSYSSIDKELAGRIKDELENYGLEVFLAHEDITPSKKWEEIILQKLDSTDIFIPIITQNFRNSLWTDQESGIAFAKNKFVVPISIENNNPYGFLGRYQASKFKVEDIQSSCKVVIELIRKDSRYKKAFIDSFIKKFASSSSFDEAGKKAKFLLELDDFSEEQINSIAQASYENGQVYESFDAVPALEVLFKKYPYVKTELVNQFNSVKFNSEKNKPETEEISINDIPF